MYVTKLTTNWLLKLEKKKYIFFLRKKGNILKVKINRGLLYLKYVI